MIVVVVVVVVVVERYCFYIIIIVGPCPVFRHAEYIANYNTFLKILSKVMVFTMGPGLGPFTAQSGSAVLFGENQKTFDFRNFW